MKNKAETLERDILCQNIRQTNKSDLSGFLTLIISITCLTRVAAPSSWDCKRFWVSLCKMQKWVGKTPLPPTAGISNLILVHYAPEIIKMKIGVLCVLHNPGSVLNMAFRYPASPEVEELRLINNHMQPKVQIPNTANLKQWRGKSLSSTSSTLWGFTERNSAHPTWHQPVLHL